MAEQHTPGPWVCKGDVGTGTLCVTDHDSRYVVDRFRACGRSDAEVVANALLIAAAPAMLALLRRLDAIGGLGYDAHDRITAVIALATTCPPGKGAGGSDHESR